MSGPNAKHDRPDRSGRHFVSLLAGLLLLGLIAGLATVGLGDDPPNTRPRAEGPRGGCDAHRLAFFITDDRAEYQRQVAFDAGDPDVIAPGFHDRPVDPTASLHAASHEYVVVYYRPDLSEAAKDRLRDLQAVGMTPDAPVLTVPREQPDALVAIGTEWMLTCRAAETATLQELVRFASETSPALAKAAVPSSP